MQTAAPRTVDAPTLAFQRDPPACQRQVADPAHLLVIAPPAPLPTVRANSCFFRLLSWMTRAYRSSNTPFNPAPATKPGSANSERIDWEFFTRLAYPKNGPLFSTWMKSGYLFHTMSYTVFRQDLPTRIRVDPEKMTVVKLREEASKFEDLKDVSGMKKPQLIDVLCQKLGVERPHAEIERIDKPTIKGRLKELQAKRKQG